LSLYEVFISKQVFLYSEFQILSVIHSILSLHHSTYSCFACGSTQQTHQRWINVETTSDFNVEFRLDLYSDLKVEIHDVVSTLKDNVDSTLKFWRCFNVEVLTLYQRCFNVETLLFQRWKTTLFQCFNSDVVSTLKHRCITLKMSKQH